MRQLVEVSGATRVLQAAEINELCHLDLAQLSHLASTDRPNTIIDSWERVVGTRPEDRQSKETPPLQWTVWRLSHGVESVMPDEAVSAVLGAGQLLRSPAQ